MYPPPRTQITGAPEGAPGRHAERVALVTGAARGIGLAIARRLVAEGASIAAVDRSADALGHVASELGERCMTIAADLSSESECARAVQACVERFGRIDIVSANAGVAVPRPFLDITESHLFDHLTVNVVGTALCVVHAARAMRDGGSGGAVVITSSINGLHVEETMAAYNTTKGALNTLVRSAAIDLTPLGIRVNGVAPGVVRTRLASPVLDDAVLRRRYLDTIPAGRFGEPEEIASAVSWLASDESAYVTGHTITIDGGQTLGIRGALELPDAAGND